VAKFGVWRNQVWVWRGQVWGVAWPSLWCGMAKFEVQRAAKFGVWRGYVWGVTWSNLGCGVAMFGVWRHLVVSAPACVHSFR
jgi:hypothetical protein